MNTNWKKLPSVLRKRKFFYRGTFNGTTYTVIQSFLTDLWNVENNHNGSLTGSQFKTAKKAMAAVEKIN